MTAHTTPIPHYQKAMAAHGDLPAMSDDAYVDRLRAQQRAIVECIDRDLWADSTSCETFTELFIEKATTCKLFVDVGAEAGFYTYLALKHMPRYGRIIAIEPDPIRCALLRELFAPHAHIEVLELAIASATGAVELVKPRGCSATLAPVDGESFTVPAAALDELLGDREVDLIKMDIEGAEAAAFDGMQRILARRRTEVFLEYHPWIDTITPGGVDMMHQMLADAAYHIYRTDTGRPERVEKLGGRAYLVPAARDALQA